MEKLSKLSLVQPRPSPKMDAIFNALEEGFPGAQRNIQPADRYACWGLIGQNALIMHEFNHVFIDMPYNGRLENDDFEKSYWRFCMDGLHDNRRLDVPSDRFEQWNTEIQPQNTDGDYVLICPSSETMTRTMHGMTMSSWVHQAIVEVESRGLKAKVRYKPRKNGTSGPSVADVPLEDDIAGASSVIVSASLVAVQAHLMGKPVFTTSPTDCPTAWCSNTNFDNLKDPLFFSEKDRQELYNNLAYKQFSIPEMRDGTCYDIATKHLGYK